MLPRLFIGETQKTAKLPALWLGPITLTDLLSENMIPKRIHLIDILRGFALIGILFANISGIGRLAFSEAPSDRFIYDLTGLVFEQRFFPIFSFLFGLGFFIFMRNADEKGLPATHLMIRRLIVLILFGIGHQFLQPGEALLLYGILGFALLPFFKRSAKISLMASLVALVFGILLTEYFVILAMFFLGMYLGKLDYFNQLERYRRPTRIVWLLSLLLIYPLLWAQQTYYASGSYSTWLAAAGLAIATAMVTSLILWRKTETWLFPLAAFGRMALTNYILQTLIVLAITFALGGFYSLNMRAVPYIWISIWPLQIILSNLWLRRFYYGPLEWLWRWGTYGRKPAFSKREPARREQVLPDGSFHD